MDTAFKSGDSISRPPTAGEVARDLLFRRLTFVFAWLVLGVCALIVAGITIAAWAAIQSYGLTFLTEKKWDTGRQVFGILPEIGGTLYSSFLGVAIGALFGVAVAILLTQDFIAPKVELFLKNLIDLLAAIPSVVYGLWGIFVLIPAIQPACNWLHGHLGWIPFFGTSMTGSSLLPAALVLAIMVLPTITAISRDSLIAVPPRLREAAFGLGATRWETILAVILPTASRGIYGSIILAFGRALGETMALAMLVGNSNEIKWSVFAPSDTLAALVANKFAEASKIEMSALMYASLVLLVITLLVNVLGTLILRHSTVFPQGAR